METRNTTKTLRVICARLAMRQKLAEIRYDDLGCTSFMERQFFSFPSPK